MSFIINYGYKLFEVKTMEIILTEGSREKFNQLNHNAIRLYIKSAC